MKQLPIAAVLLAGAGFALAKLPAPQLDDAAKAKAAETAARAAWQAKVDAFQLCKAQDRVVAAYQKSAKGATAPASAVKTVAAARPAASAAPAAAPAASAAAPAASVAGTPMTTPPIPPCIDPGPFAYNPPEQKPLETSGAHSPTGTAASPPSVRPESAQMAPAKK